MLFSLADDVNALPDTIWGVVFAGAVLADVVKGFLQLVLHLGEIVFVNNEHLLHVIGQQPTRVPDVDGCLCIGRSEYS